LYGRPKRPRSRGTIASGASESLTAKYTTAAVQPPLRKRRQIRQDPRPDRPLVYEQLSDPILVKRAKDGDPRALATLCERHAPRVERRAGHLLSDPEDARDAAQEALAKLCVRLRQFRGESQFSTWLHRLVVNTCRDVSDRQRVRRCEPLLDDDRVSVDADPAREAALSELRHELAAKLASLSHEQASVVVLKDALGFSFAEISARSGMPVGTAKCYAHRARAGLRARLTDDAAA
jgi:RNA polymerase sigma-70 factor, ECF subfamily